MNPDSILISDIL